MITVEPTRDTDWMWKVATHPAIYDGIRGGECFERESISPVVCNTENHFLKALKDGVPMGFFAYHGLADRHLFDLHICILPEFRGKSAIIAFQMSLVWIFESTAAQAILAVFKACRRDVKLFIARAGFKRRWENGGNCCYKLERTELCLG